MSIETARRILIGGWIPRAEVELSLLQAVIREIPLVQALYLQRAEWSGLLDQELEKSNVPAIRRVHGKVELCADLPVGMCERLLAIPVRQEAITGTVDVAAVDPFDVHVQQEFSFHLDAPVRVLRASLDEVTAALEGLHTGGAFTEGVQEMLGIERERTPTHGSDLPAAGAPPEHSPGASASEPPGAAGFSSQPPIPLVQRVPGGPRLRGSTSPGVGSQRAFRAPEEDEDGQPVIGLTRPKQEASDAITRSRLREADLAQVERQLASTKSPDEVVDLLSEHACPEGSSIVFSVRTDGYLARSASFEVRGLRDVDIPKGRPNVFQAALESGHYLGKLPETLVHALLRDLLAERLGLEVYVAPVLVGGRATLMVLATGFERSFATTRRIDRLANAAGEALERLLIERKRSR